MGKQEDFDIVDLDVSDLNQEDQAQREILQKDKAQKDFSQKDRAQKDSSRKDRVPGSHIQENPVKEKTEREPSGGGKDLTEPESYWEEETQGTQEERKSQKDSGKRGQIIGMICIGAGLLCLLAGACILIKSHLDDRAAHSQLEALRSQGEENPTDAPDPLTAGSREDGGRITSSEGAGPQDTSAAMSLEDAHSTDEETVPQEPERTPNPYADSFLGNSDMEAWLKIEGTKIDYPVMQTMEDENYYLKRGFDKKSNQNGCLILDTDSSLGEPVSTNQIIHGHNMKSGEMFGTLTKYEDPDYCKEHSSIQLYTKECLRNYEVIAVFRSQVYKKTDDVFKFYKFFQADTQEEFDDWYNNIKALSEFDTGVTAEFGDRFLTLSTCVYHVDNGRLVVVAKETEPGELYEAVDQTEQN